MKTEELKKLLQKQKHTISTENTIEYLWVVAEKNMLMKNNLYGGSCCNGTRTKQTCRWEN